MERDLFTRYFLWLYGKDTLSVNTKKITITELRYFKKMQDILNIFTKQFQRILFTHILIKLILARLGEEKYQGFSAELVFQRVQFERNCGLHCTSLSSAVKGVFLIIGIALGKFHAYCACCSIQ